MIEGDIVSTVALSSSWTARHGPGCELVVGLASGRRLFVIRTSIASSRAELEAWRARVGGAVSRAKEVVSWPLAPGGRQVTLDVLLEDGFQFEADLIETPAGAPPTDTPLETEWTFEGTPGVEMGKRQQADE